LETIFFVPSPGPGTQDSMPHQVQGENQILAHEIEPSAFRLSGTRSTILVQW